LFTRRHLIRYLTYLVAAPSILVVRNWWWRVLIALGAISYMVTPSKRLLKRESPTLPRFAWFLLITAGVRAIGDLAKMSGYPVGLYWRWKRYGLQRDWRSIPFSARRDIR
jgi:hypothetical protein